MLAELLNAAVVMLNSVLTTAVGICIATLNCELGEMLMSAVVVMLGSIPVVTVGNSPDDSSTKINQQIIMCK